MSRTAAPHTGDPFGTLNGEPFYNVSYTSFPKQELNPLQYDYARERDNALNHNSKDGVKPMTKEEQAFERELNWKLIKKFTRAIFKMDVTKFSFPVGYSEPRTFMERAADLFGFLVNGFIDKITAETLPEKKLAYMASSIIAGFHLYLQQKKPWNPVLGETYVGRWSNGVTFWGEQTSHHPPISNVQIRPDDNKWKIDAQFNFVIDQGFTQINIHQKGTSTLTLEDGTVYQWEFPTIIVNGLLHGDRIVKVLGPLCIKDVSHNLEAFVKISPSKGKEKGLESPRATTVWGGVREAGAKAETFKVRITGDYADKVLIDDTEVWNLSSDIINRPGEIIPDEEMLPSDARFRIDRSWLIQGNIDVADEAKTLLEELQRKDAKLRAKTTK